MLLSAKLKSYQAMLSVANYAVLIKHDVIRGCFQSPLGRGHEPRRKKLSRISKYNEKIYISDKNQF